MVSQHGSTALMLACSNRHSEIASLLIASGADLNVQRNVISPLMSPLMGLYQDGYTVLMYACTNGLSEMAAQLLEYGADFSITDKVRVDYFQIS